MQVCIKGFKGKNNNGCEQCFPSPPLQGGTGGIYPLDLRQEGLSPLGRHRNLEKFWRWISIFSSKNVQKLKENGFYEGKKRGAAPAAR